MKRHMVVFLAASLLFASGAEAKSKLEKALKKMGGHHSATKMQESAPSATVTQAPVPSTTILDRENGFHGVPFGADQSSSYFFGAVLANASGDFTLLSRPSDPPAVGAVRVNRILWLFYQHKLEAVLFDTIGFDNGAALRAAFEASYGKPAADARATPGFQRLKWAGHVAELTETINGDLGTVNVSLVSVAIRKLAAAARTPPAK